MVGFVFLPPTCTSNYYSRTDAKSFSIIPAAVIFSLMRRCQLTLPELQDLFLRGKSVDTTFSLQKGIIQSVTQPAIP
jgi:hypothetical protein